ncbi:MAG: MASE3 domain-containing protein, partial [Pseudomonadota bacterium]
APLLLERHVPRLPTFFGIGAVAGMLMALVLTGNFPDCYVEGVGLTPFKVAAEGTVMAVLAVALAVLWRVRAGVPPGVLGPLALAILAFILGEIAFSYYVDVYGLSNLVGHLCKLVAYWLIFVAILRTTLLEPYVSLGEARDQLRSINEELERRVEERTAQLRSTERLANALINAPPDAAMLLDREGTVLATNPVLPARLGVKVEALVGTSIFDHLPSEVSARRRQLFTKALASHQPLRFMDERDGRVYDNTLYPVDPEGHDDWRIAAYSRDVTDQVRTEEELRRSNQELEHFAYVASHDMREPLRMITSYLHLLERRHGDALDSEAREFIAFASDGAKRLDDLILDLLDYSRIGRKGQPFAPVPTGETVRAVLADLAMAIDDGNARVTVTEGLPVVLGDAVELRRLFQNLIGNALKYRHPDRTPVIEVGCRPDGERWEFAVADNGIGIPAADADRVFQIFQRLHGRTQYEGTGIGLAVCKKVVERHGGRIWVEPTEPGSTFRFTLPRAGD